MRPEFCMVCNKVTQFNNAVFTARNIVSRLERMTVGMKEPERNSAYYHMMQNLCCDKMRIPFPCGQCYKVNMMELTNLEDKMNELICTFIANTTSKNKEYHELLRLLAGHYSMKYRAIETAISQKERAK